MKIFIIGLPESGRTTVSKAIAKACDFEHIDAMAWVRKVFREPEEGEHPQQYEDEYRSHFSKRMLINPYFITDHVKNMMSFSEKNNPSFVIDGIINPADFSHLFDYRTDIIVFLNRTDNEAEMRDSETIGVSVIRDYCFWLAATGLLPKDRWLEYNFKIPGEPSGEIKARGAQNTFFIVKSIEKVISHLIERLSSK